MLKLHVVTIAIVVVLIAGGIFVISRQRASTNPREAAHEYCTKYLTAMSDVCLRCTPRSENASDCAVEKKFIDQCSRAERVKDEAKAATCLKDLSSMPCSDFARQALPTSCSDQLVFTGL